MSSSTDDHLIDPTLTETPDHDHLIDPSLRETPDNRTSHSKPKSFRPDTKLLRKRVAERRSDEELRKHRRRSDALPSVSIPRSSTPQEKLNPTSDCASSWTHDYLERLNVQIVDISIEEFFGRSPENLPAPTFIYEELEALVTEELREIVEKDLDPQIARYIQLVWAAQRNRREALTNILATDTLRILGFERLGSYDVYNLIGSEYRLYFEYNNKKTCAVADQALLLPERNLLGLFVENKRLECEDFPHAQVFAEALAAYNVNNMECRNKTNKPSLPDNVRHELNKGYVDMIIPAVSMIGSIPCFYLIPITAAFASAVARGKTPHNLRVYVCHAPYTHNPVNPIDNVGQTILSYRKLCLSMFEAFKDFIPTNFFELCRFNSIFKAYLEEDPLRLPTQKNTILDRVERDIEGYSQFRNEHHLSPTPNYFSKRSAWFNGKPCKQLFAPHDEKGHPFFGSMHPPAENAYSERQNSPTHPRSRRRSSSVSSVAVSRRNSQKMSDYRFKSASAWTDEDLQKLNVEIVELTIEDFFGYTLQTLPTPKFIHNRLNDLVTKEYDGIPNKSVDIQVARYIQLVCATQQNQQEALTDSLASETLRILGFENLGNYRSYNQISHQHLLYLEAQENQTCAIADLVLLCPEGSSLSLFVENKRFKCTQFPHAQVFAQALAAYNVNNMESRNKTKELKLNNRVRHVVNYGHVDMIIPAFSMIGSNPCFYLIPITAAFASAVAQGETPHPLRVYTCCPPQENFIKPVSVTKFGQMLLSRRRLCLSMFEAFKDFVPTNFFELCHFNPVFEAHLKMNPPKSPIWQTVKHDLQTNSIHHHNLSPTKNFFLDESGLCGEPVQEFYAPQVIPPGMPLPLPEGPPC